MVRKKALLPLVFLIVLALLAPILTIKSQAIGTSGKITIHLYQVDTFDGLNNATGKEEDNLNLPSVKVPISNVEFTIHKMKNMDHNAIDPTFTPIKKRTDVNGFLEFNSLQKGIYNIIQKVPIGYKAQSKTFKVKIPHQGYYDVHVYPKNIKGTDISKVHSSNKKVVGCGDTPYWTIKFPTNVDFKDDGNYATGLILSDIMDDRLDYIANSIDFVPCLQNDAPITSFVLTKGIDYTESFDAASRTVKWEFTDNATKKIADANVAYLKAILKTKINAEALGTTEDVWNNASVEYTTTNNVKYKKMFLNLRKKEFLQELQA